MGQGRQLIAGIGSLRERMNMTMVMMRRAYTREQLPQIQVIKREMGESAREK